MISLVVSCLLMRIATSQYTAPSHNQQQSGATKVLYPAAPLHYVNIGHQLAGDYTFGYDTGKGPLGQSFREEMRLADGTVRGTYGVIDETGHKRVVHYSAGKGGFMAEEDKKLSTSALTVGQRQPKHIMQQSFNSFPRQLPIFKPSNYLQARNIQPVYTASVPVQPAKLDAPENKLTLLEKVDKPVAPFYRLPSPIQKVNIALPMYKSSVPAKTEQGTVTPVRGQSYGVLQEQRDTAGASTEVYKPLRRVTKKPVASIRQQGMQKERKVVEEISYDPKIEDEYYDSSKAFIDIERLSYNIGSDRSSASI